MEGPRRVRRDHSTGLGNELMVDVSGVSVADLTPSRAGRRRQATTKVNDAVPSPETDISNSR